PAPAAWEAWRIVSRSSGRDRDRLSGTPDRSPVPGGFDVRPRPPRPIRQRIVSEVPTAKRRRHEGPFRHFGYNCFESVAVTPIVGPLGCHTRASVLPDQARGNGAF